MCDSKDNCCDETRLQTPDLQVMIKQYYNNNSCTPIENDVLYSEAVAFHNQSVSLYHENRIIMGSRQP